MPEPARRLSRRRLFTLAAVGVLPSPAKPRPPDPLPDVRELHVRAFDECSAARAAAEDADRRRTHVIAQARRLGCSSTVIATRLGLTPQRVRQNAAWRDAEADAEAADTAEAAEADARPVAA